MSERLTNIYLHMIDRCYNPNSKAYKNYGARGITICEEWYIPRKRKGKVFKKWALENGYAEDLTIDRIDVNKGYCPENCRWISRELQNNNKRNNRYITYKEKTQTIAQWGRELGISPKTIAYRLEKNYLLDKVFGKNKLVFEASQKAEVRKKKSDGVKAFMSNPANKERWRKTLAKR